MAKRDQHKLKLTTSVVYKKFSLSYKVVLLIAFILLIAFFFYYTENVRSQIIEYNKRIVNVYARLWTSAVAQTVGGEELNIIFEEIILKCDFPMVFTNVEGQVTNFRNLSIDPSEVNQDNIEKLNKELDDIKKQNKPVPIYLGDTREILGYIYFGESRFIRWLRLLPIFEVILLSVFIIIGFAIYGRIKSYEQQNIWLGMARETAHQLGTPLSSLLGWIELLEARLAEMEKNCEIELAKVDQDSKTMSPYYILDEMKNDIELLNRIVVRFGKIGSIPDIEDIDVNTITQEVVQYLKERLSPLREYIQMTERYTKLPKARGNSYLLRWALENLIKNSIEAIDTREGKISVSTRVDLEGEKVCIIVTDNGRGIPSKAQKDIFAPGFTTKKRGWGLGLSLAKRIVEQQQNGKLYLLESKSGEKTTFVIALPIKEGEEIKDEVD
ncbi:HAMP domain-containing histidine kinase [bacterium]|nr:HAMP domain-containing histidine kinase [bacterium]